ncbi:MAG TPA: acetolactate synthase large subunit, partial [Maribacter sp.]|nr:acetolactate synthase large subunit [Maribacter sp.]
FEIDPAEVNKNVHADVAVLGNSKETLGLILPLLNENKHESWHNMFKEKYKIEFDTIIKNDIHPTKEGLTMGEVIEEINLASNNKAVIVSDVGQHQMIACRYS